MREYRYSVPGWILSFVIIVNIMASPYFQIWFLKMFVEGNNVGLSIIIATFAIIATPAAGYIISAIPIAWFNILGGYSRFFEKKLRYSLKEEIRKRLPDKEDAKASGIFDAPSDSFLSVFWQSNHVDQKLVDWVTRRWSVYFINRGVDVAIVIGNVVSLFLVSRISGLNWIHYLIIVGSIVTIILLEINVHCTKKEGVGAQNILLERAFNEDFGRAYRAIENGLKNR